MAIPGPFRGNCLATVDDRGRLKLPTAFRTLAHDTYGPDFFLTSFSGESLLVYPLPVWLEMEARIAALASTDPTRIKLLRRVAYFGQPDTLDSQGRLLVPARVRESAGIIGEVDVLGQLDYLDVWSHDRVDAQFKSDPFTNTDLAALAVQKV